MDARFEIATTEDGQFHFVLKAPNNEVICQSETYTKKHNAEKGIEAIKKYASEAEVVDLTEE